MATQSRIVKKTERVADVAREANQQGCIVHIRPDGRCVIRPHALPGMVRINQMFYRSAA